jgi:enterochelin esterase-like enzyme
MNNEPGLLGLRWPGTCVTSGRPPLAMLSLLALLTSLSAVGCIGPEPTAPSTPAALATSVDARVTASVASPPTSIGDIPLTATSTPSAVTPTESPSITASSTPIPTADATSPPTPSANTPTVTPACTEVRGRIDTGTFFSGVIGREQPYRIYLPPCYDFHAERYPVLYMLHGYPYDDAHWDDLGIDEAADAGIASGSLSPFMIAMPAADNEGTFTKTSGGPASFEGVVMAEFIPYVESRYRASGTAEGRAIGGMSRGGVWSLEIAFRNPDHFSAVGGHSAALNVNLAGPAYDPLHLAADPGIRSLRIYLDTGSGDWTLPGMEDLHAALTAAGVSHQYNIRDGVHRDEYWSEHVAEYLAFYAAAW